jgi:tRNA (adenine57-N1/adenine58-N1)-methyltransferase
MKNPSLPFAENDPVIFYDRKQRIYYDLLRQGRHTNIRGDLLPHNQIIGRGEGFILHSQREKPYWVFRPTLNDHVVHMRRGATVIYPKDLGLMLQYADIYPGAKVVEAGLGSGALATALLRVVGQEGSVISYDVRQDFIVLAQRNLLRFLGETPNHLVREADIYERFDDDNVDRLLLDVPEPWRVIPLATPKLRPGAIVCSYSPTIIQSKSLVEALRAERCYLAINTIESLVRPWNIAGLSVRPELRMVGHTGFLTFGRKTENVAFEAPSEPEATEAETQHEEEHETPA